ncbi:glycosyltransferase [Clostridium sp.]|uniref:glycosyltransferase n=1 Tax=Clostridium sp. TaxID=1506 RepID=UPI003D6C8554
MKVSICMMVKNEEKYLDKCLTYLQKFMKSVDSELIIVDTGSEDSTVDIAKKYTDKVYFHKWNNNFSDMRNITINYASGEWIFIIDADEMLVKYGDILKFINSEYDKKYNTVFITVKNITGSKEGDYSTFSSPRIFKNDGIFKYEGAVHNNPVFKKPYANVDVLIEHYGYIFTDKEFTEKKFQRTATILKSELEKQPENIYYWYQLSVSYSIHGEEQEALNCALNAFKLMEKDTSKKQRKDYLYVYTQLSLCYLKIQNFNMVEYVCNKAVEEGNKHIDIYYLLGKSQMLMKKNNMAIESYEKYLIELDNYQPKKSVAVQVYFHGKKQYVYFDMFILYKRSGVLEKALEYFSKIKDEGILNHEEAIEENINLYLNSNDYNGLSQFYNSIVKKYGNKDLFILHLEKYTGDNKIDNNKIKNILDEENSYTDLLNFRVKIENNSVELLKDGYEFDRMLDLDFNELYYFYGDILYYYMKNSLDNSIKLLKNINESKLIVFFQYLDGKYVDFQHNLSEILYFNVEQDLKCICLKKSIAKYLINVTKFEDEKYKKLFKTYVECGIKYMFSIYDDEFLRSEQIYFLKDEEEAFFKYIYTANLFKSSDEKAYLKYLNKALNIDPYMHRGIKFLLEEFQEIKDSKELENYKKQVIENINGFISENKIDEAKELVNQYESIICNDPEIESIKAMFM